MAAPAAADDAWAFPFCSGGVSCDMKMFSVMETLRARARIWNGRR